MGLTPLSHPCDPAVAHLTSRIMGGLVRYRENATLPLNPDYNYITANSTALTSQTQRRRVGGFVRYRGAPDHPRIKVNTIILLGLP